MIYLQLFLTFLKIGAFTFGGGYAMIPLIRESVLSYGWMSEEQILNFIAVAESTPGPIAVNMATFIGSSQGGILGSLLATLGVVLPSFFMILAIAALARGLMKRAGVRAAISGVRPAIIGMLLATAISMLLLVVLGISTVGAPLSLDLRALLIFIALGGCMLLFRHFKKRPLSPILLIFLSGALGMLLYGL